MIRDRNIVCVASNWSDPPTSKHHVMRRLARDNRVLWINYHASRRPALTAADARLALRRVRQALWPSASASPRGADARISVVTPLLMPWPESPRARRFNAWQMSRCVRRAFGSASNRPTQLWLFTPDAPELIERVKWERIVYYCVDEFSAFAGYNGALVAALEEQTLARSDVVLTTSQPLYEQRRNRHPNVHLISHGVDYDHFAAARGIARGGAPADLAGMRPPVFGYFGVIDAYVDIDLIAGVAKARPAWSFVLIGDVRSDVSALRPLANVRLLGRVAYQDLPQYCAAFDVGLIPFRRNRLTHAVNPLKLREYLAAGLPVLSAGLPEVRGYAPAVRLAESVQEFIAAANGIDAWRTDPAVRAVQERVRSESWEARLVEIADAVMGASAAGIDSHVATALLQRRAQSSGLAELQSV